MAVEREHKFLVVGAFPEPARLQEAYRMRGRELRPSGQRKQNDVYYDTPDLRLLRNGIALRIRRVGGEMLATYKGSGQVTGSLHAREEIERPYAAPWPAEIMAKLLPLGVLNTLEPLLHLYTRRTRYLLLEGSSAKAELSFDEVRADHGAQEVQFNELELEAQPDLPEGDLEDLAGPLAAFSLTPHAGDKLTHALTLLGLLDI